MWRRSCFWISCTMGTAADAEGAIYYHFDFFDYAPSLLAKDSYWFEVGRILRIDSADNHGQGGAKGENGLKALWIDRSRQFVTFVRSRQRKPALWSTI